MKRLALILALWLGGASSALAADGDSFRQTGPNDKKRNWVYVVDSATTTGLRTAVPTRRWANNQIIRIRVMDTTVCTTFSVSIYGGEDSTDPGIFIGTLNALQDSTSTTGTSELIVEITGGYAYLRANVTAASGCTGSGLDVAFTEFEKAD